MEWQLKTIADIAEPVNGIVDGPFGSNLKKSDYIDDSENGIPVLTTKNLHGDYSKDSVRYISKEKYEVIKRSTVYPGDILVAKIGSIGTCGIYPLSCKNALIPANLLKITVLPTVDRKYVYYYIQSRGFQEKIKAISTATAQPAFNVTKFRKLPIPTPPLPEQERIVARIEELFSQLDAGVETLKKTKAQLAVYRQAVLKEAFEGKYTPDVTMHEIKMGEIADGKDGLRRGPFGSAIKKAFFVESGYKVYEQGNAINNDCKRGHYYISADKYNELSSFQLKPGDFIVSCSGTIGKIAQLPADAEPGVINQALMRIRLKPDVIDPYYFMMQFRSEVFQRKIVSRGSGMGNLAGIKEFKLATMFIPENYENQKQIVAEIESRMSVCDSIEQTVDTALQQAEAMRQSILKDAFEGKL